MLPLMEGNNGNLARFQTRGGALRRAKLRPHAEGVLVLISLNHTYRQYTSDR